MQEVLIEKLHQYIAENNPDLLIALQEKGNVSGYLKEKIAEIDLLMNELLAINTPAYIIEERCMDELTKELRPSKFNYLISVLEEEFTSTYYRLKEGGLLTYEVINLIESCIPVFETFGFTLENENNRYLRYAIIGAVKEYFENKQ
ncbi:hypothetical protein SAMN05444410_101327 [Hydrobacter penzbergensis]|uniref:DUF1896 domain-containing protein n=1 Tax=Hydrobacter penzbergensis TaxID=1235997 RepID=A0A8X8L9V9_9BACT|nr:hypothetical protein [Hydrobacter penzbergensis]SDW14012.1 hypothetical protein SAMN05444410_101327 [Hydrobacter penzbergensis]